MPDQQCGPDLGHLDVPHAPDQNTTVARNDDARHGRLLRHPSPRRGTEVRLRLLSPADREKLLAAFDRLSPESRYRRFFTVTPRLPEKLLRRLLDTDGWNHFAIGAETATEDPTDAEGGGVARFIRLNDAPDVAEAAVTVVDHMQRRRHGFHVEGGRAPPPQAPAGGSASRIATRVNPLSPADSCGRA